MMNFCYKYKFHTTSLFVGFEEREATCSNETSVNFQRCSRRYIPEDRNLHDHGSENLKSHVNLKSLWKRTGLACFLDLRFSWPCLWRKATSCLPSVSSDFLFGLFSTSTWRWYVRPKRRHLSELNDVKTQETLLFIYWCAYRLAILYLFIIIIYLTAKLRFARRQW
jgi:hypothetical protein